MVRASSLRLALLFTAALAMFATGCGDDATVTPPSGDTGDGDVSEADTGDDTGSEDTGGSDDGGGAAECIDQDDDTYGLNCDPGPDCNDLNADVNPGAEEICGDRFDNDCDGDVDEDCTCSDGQVEACYEGDPAVQGVGACRDGYRVCDDGVWSDCNHGSPRDEICDARDNDCDGSVDEGVSNSCGTCGAPPEEICGDFLDNDCNGAVDDVEGCSCEGRTNQPCYTGPPATLGFGICRGGVAECADDAFVACLGEVLPAVEVCNGLDDDCDGQIDEGLANSCGVCGAADPVETCNGIDDDCNGQIDEGLTNLCGECGAIDEPEECGDGLDNDCDGEIDESCGCFDGATGCWPGRADQRGVGECTDGVRECDPSGEFWGPCEGAILPGIEICDGLDNDCDGEIDEGPDGCSVCGGELEICDGLDNDCDGQIDEFLRNACGQCIEGVEPEEDCGPTCCDGVDNDCDGLVDEGLVNVCGVCFGPCFVESWGEEPGEWAEGESEGLEVDVTGGLRLGSSFSGLPYLWVANSGEATVSRINTETITEESRYPVGQSPSRTAVDFRGNVFVANRAFSGQGTVTRVDVRDCEGADCVQYNAPVGPNDAVPRGMAVDADGFPWVGTYNDRTLRRLDPTTGLVIESHFVDARVYGIAIDSEGIIWFTNLEIPEFTGGRLGAFDTTLGEVVGTWEIPGCSNPYGIAVDVDGNVWLGNFTCNNLVRFDRLSETFTSYETPGLDRTRGVAVDGDGFVWVASYGTDRVAKFDPEAEAFVGTYPACSGPIGIGIANDNHVWVPCYSSNNVVRLTPEGARAGEVSVGRNPYSYSDLTGFQLRNFTARRGIWTVQFDCGVENCTFNEVVWDADMPDETDIQLRARVSNDATSWSGYAGPFIDLPANLSGLPPGRYIELEMQLRTSNRDLTPLLNLVELYWSTP